MPFPSRGTQGRGPVKIAGLVEDHPGLRIFAIEARSKKSWSVVTVCSCRRR